MCALRISTCTILDEHNVIITTESVTKRRFYANVSGDASHDETRPLSRTKQVFNFRTYKWAVPMLCHDRFAYSRRDRIECRTPRSGNARVNTGRRMSIQLGG